MRKCAALLALAAVILLVSCSGDVNDTLFSEERYTVMFDAGGETAPWGITVTSGTVIGPPDDPVREGYVFVGWLEDGRPFDFSSRIMRDIWLSASWERDVGQIRITVSFDGSPMEDGTPVSLSGPEEISGLTISGVFSVTDLPTGTYQVSAAGYVFGAVDIVLGESKTFPCDLFTVTVSASDGIISVSGNTVARRGDLVPLSSGIEGGYTFSGWFDGAESVCPDSVGQVEVTHSLDLTAKAHRTAYPITVSGSWYSPGSAEPPEYMKEREAEQWFVISPPVRHGYRVVSYEVVKTEGGGTAAYENGLLKLGTGTYGAVTLDPVWEKAGGPVTVSILKDGDPWEGSGHVLSLVGDTTMPPEEATESGSLWTWTDVSYGTYRVYADGVPTTTVLTVSDESGASASADWWTVTAVAGEGIASVSGEAVLPSGGYVTLSAVAREGRLFDSWREGGALYSTSRTVTVGPVTSARTLLAVGFAAPVPEILPIEGTVFLALDIDNGAIYRFYDSGMNEIPQPWTVQTLSEAQWYSVSGIPETPRFWIVQSASVSGESYMWGTFGVASDGRRQGLGAGEYNTARALTTSIDTETLWESLPEGWFVGGRDETDALIAAFPSMGSVPVWSSEESDRYGSWIRSGGQWAVAGKNTFAAMYPMRMI